jgi:hypothetical protein
MRLEMRRIHALFDTPIAGEVQSASPPEIARWYGAGRRELRDAIRFLETVKQDFANSGHIREELKRDLDKAFGVEFRESLTEWMSMSLDATYLAHHVAAHEEIFGKGLPSPNNKEGMKVILDPNQGHQMGCKLIDQQLRHLRDLQIVSNHMLSEVSEAENAGAVDFAPRYFGTASQDLHRAVDWFISLKEHNM